MSVVIADVRTAAPELRDTGAVPDAEVSKAITDATSQLSTEAWATDLDLATIWLAAHYLAVAHPELSQMPGARVRSGESASLADDAGELGQSRYGILLHGMRRSTLGARMPVVA